MEGIELPVETTRLWVVSTPKVIDQPKKQPGNESLSGNIMLF